MNAGQRVAPGVEASTAPAARRAVPRALALLIASALGLAACGRPEAPTASSPPAASAPVASPVTDESLAERGRLLAVMGHCAGCHSSPDHAPYSGGVALPTPFGTVFGGNLTPDPDHGLGRWTADDFWRALHAGRGRDGRALVPAFPYTSYTHVTREDSDALFAYLRSLAPVARPSRPHELRFPYGAPWALSMWQFLFFEPANPVADAARRAAMPPEAARGAYLVDGLGHCAACHAPRNAWGAPAAESTGGEMPGAGWYAPSLHPPAEPRGPAQSAARSAAEIVALLRDGQTARDTVLGPMAEVVRHSTQHWPASDLDAVGEHLAALPPRVDRSPGSSGGDPADTGIAARRDLGARLYADRCADCHGAEGEGVPGAYPALAGNATVQHPDARNLVRVLRLGGFPPTTAAHPRPYGMPPQRLSDAQVAALLTHLRLSWGHRAGAVTELDVLQLR